MRARQPALQGPHAGARDLGGQLDVRVAVRKVGLERQLQRSDEVVGGRVWASGPARRVRT